jgi:NAD-dependent deacetylase
MEPALERVIDHLSRARSALFITGAGLSAESGLPTYRGIGGLYENATTEEGVPIERALSGPMLQTHPALTWKYIHQIERACRGGRPNRGHELIAELERGLDRCWVLTQNVDGFHRAAGSRNVIDIHGDIHQLRCTQCIFAERVDDYAHLAPLPKCPDCGSVLRPEVVLFDEALPDEKLGLLRREVMRGFDIVFSVGTTSLFPYIANPVLDAAARGRPTVEINPGETVISGEVEVRLVTGAVAAFEALWAARDRWLRR